MCLFYSVGKVGFYVFHRIQREDNSNMTDTEEYNKYNVLTGDWYNVYSSDCAYCDLRKENFSAMFLCLGLEDEVPLNILCGLESCSVFSGTRPEYLQKRRDM